MAFGVFNNRDQAEEEERTQNESGQARAHAKRMVIAVSHALQPQDNPREPKKLHHLLEVKPTRGNASNVSQPATGPKVPERAPWSMPSLQTNRSL